MKGFACQYAIVRFLPFVETGEFANVGVVLACPERGYFDAKLMHRRKTGRVAAFFEPLDKRIFREAMKYFQAELERVRELAVAREVSAGPRLIQHLFEGLTRARESLLRFGETRVVMAADPAATLASLYGQLVERDFADDKSYQDKLLERAVRDLLIRAKLKPYFRQEEIGNDELHVGVPFVHVRDDRPVMAIKPLDLAREQANKIYDAGGPWVDRIRRLKRHRLLPEQFLFAVKRPHSQESTAALSAADEIEGDLRELQVQVASVDDAQAIQAFASMARAAA